MNIVTVAPPVSEAVESGVEDVTVEEVVRDGIKVTEKGAEEVPAEATDAEEAAARVKSASYNLSSRSESHSKYEIDKQ